MRMPGVATSNGLRVLRRLVPLLAVAALLVAIPLASSSHDATTGGGDRRAALDRGHTFALTDTAATTPHGQDRRHAPVGALPALAIAALVMLTGLVVARRRRVVDTKPRGTFRRRAPPSFQTAY
jgi:hypothetical protein